MQKYLAVLCLTLALTIELTGCFNENTTSFSNAASTSVTSVNTSEMAECNKMNIAPFSFTGQVSTYYAAGTGQIAPTYLLMDVSTYPAALLTSSTVELQFVPWYEVVAGSKYYSSTPLNFYFMDKTTFQTSPSTPVNILNLALIKEAMSQLDFAGSGFTINDFFAHEMIVLVNVNTEFEAMSVAYYDTSVSQNAQSSGDVLLPPFYADPNAFAQAYQLADLYNLHPFASYIGQNTTGLDFGYLDEQICAQMASAGGRVPASVEGVSSKAELTEKLRAVRYLAAGKTESANPRGEPQVGVIARVWRAITESLVIQLWWPG